MTKRPGATSDWLDWLDWPCPVSAVFHNHPQDLFSLLYFNLHLFFLNMKPLSEVVPGFLVIQIPIQAV
jgi:hypothetical protein